MFAISKLFILFTIIGLLSIFRQNFHMAAGGGRGRDVFLP
jgi:hypothetical protein